MLEALSLLKDRPLPRQVTFLFNEGEELGLIGARAFLDADPLRPPDGRADQPRGAGYDRAGEHVRNLGAERGGGAAVQGTA
jgi:acetylornithine deacetylase/succinyl-diaminopimelate desuccinylase-like protein